MGISEYRGRAAGAYLYALSGGQSFLDVVGQMAKFLNDLARDWDGHRVLVVGHSATRWALDHLLTGTPLENLVDAPFGWREGWTYTLDESGA